MNKILVAPSILSADFTMMADAVQKLEKSGADMLHCDVMDGVFVRNMSFGPKMVEDIRKRTKLPLDCHLMIIKPEDYIQRFADVGADYITVHYETLKERLPEVLQDIKKLGVKCGAVINPDTPPSVLNDCLELCDMVLVMSVYPGFGGQKFIESSLPKLRELRKNIELCKDKPLLQIDGGITIDNAGLVINAGANVIVAGSAVFNADDMKAAIDSLRISK